MRVRTLWIRLGREWSLDHFDSERDRQLFRRKAGGWPTFTFFVKLGTHAADAGVFILISPH